MKPAVKNLKKRLKKSRANLADKLSRLVKKSRRVDDELIEDIEEILIEGDVGINLTAQLIEHLRVQIKERNIRTPEEVITLLKNDLIRMLQCGNGGKAFETSVDRSPHVIMIVGVNGVGKTTTIGKIAHAFRRKGKSVLLAAGDTFRAAATEQLVIWADRAGCDIVRQQEGADPASVAYDALSATIARRQDVLIIDTAGRLHTRTNLMEELRKVKRVLDRQMPGSPQEILLVVDANTGQNALSQAKIFHEALNITGLVLAKLDGTAKGGIILAIAHELSIPVKMVGLGEGIADIADFHPEEFIEALFEMD
jgi:fused signal recognition particle receptor